MCGIVGIVGQTPVAPLIVDALKRLEYRGYDSAGVATIENGELARRRAEGKLVNLERRLKAEPLDGNIGIGHTRWATHGVPNETNAHPHFSNGVAIVHNGIIENFAELRQELMADGYEFTSQTDTEVVAHLIARELARGTKPIDAAHAALKRLNGAFALAIMFKGDEDLIVGARNGPPLAVGHGEGEMFLGSDAIALAPFTNSVTYLEDGDWAVVRRNEFQIYTMDRVPVERQRRQSVGTSYLVDKGNHRHFMEKEIHEQPEVISHTLAHYLDFTQGTSKPLDLPFNFADIDRLAVSACGTAYLAGLVGKYWFERHARLPVDIDVASEFRYREMPISRKSAAFFVSQSGETADTLASLRYCRKEGVPIGAIVNVRESTMARESDVVMPTLAGPEIGVASTKAFTCQLSVLAALTIRAASQRGTITAEEEKALVRSLSETPRYAAQVLKLDKQIEKVSRELASYKHVLYLGRDTNFPLAMEGALKLKEISYIHAEGYAAGELKHGPIALIDENMPVIVIAPHDRIFEKTVSNMQEVAARGGKIILITDQKGAAQATVKTLETIVLPDVPEFIAPIIYALPIQMLAYFTAVFMGTDVDQPRNLAKSVTVE
ncbi:MULTISPECIES: glutamine--fructose-6-phosphate transaminase (isomerizing) [Aminobacter]|jgi:glucosamine--fructose-6-phosphate aminotransferase (isomerizing)|uniref:Glutamine--fructose-6-phosphate aminotransferase [isomerizing] n=2 Tax=Aminobacter TaxID=31988 RepID=A0AAC8YQF1_AMIAI|nr:MULTISPECIES: glutamine--fructose-6-phosphate transaminase (isomerizing) [Aminobacter]AMS42627.1 glucosamine--fructose-6-phosphate aminotransferase [Aminobacter aminovorans]MBA8906771.1 glucosamine--fructose-6-phosphate aminotransferase (isomerizing) [Aminobacter ciceronei]MBA9020550.1 glucosamine--fructose-6-phosphate aminotransferase (isomerizing) [Aminobacter ciceronei]MBB3709410.1 glucosamine--fructose-6-phosphate aminotransferase (isomerizing) [Aminobacter aminovorans]MRX37277.1 glutam